LLFGSLGAAPVGEDIRRQQLSAPAPSGGEALVRGDLEQVAVAPATSDSTASGRIGEMSDEEKERRRQVCDRELQWCRERCQDSYRDPGKRSSCYSECSNKYAACLKPIPY
jgi:hypothetical protein